MRKALLERYLKDAGGNVTQAAKRAGLNRPFFYQLMAAAGIEPANRGKRGNRGNAEWRALQ